LYFLSVHDPQAQTSEGPVHEVTLSPYLLSKYEMTQGQWVRLTGHNPSQFQRVRFDTRWSRVKNPWSLLQPVEQVSWEDGMTATKRLGLALPSEAQWERACRAGSATAWWSGDEQELLHDVANLKDDYAQKNGYEIWTYWEEWLDDGYTGPSRVGASRPNAFGLHEVHGNLWEACLDAHDSAFYARSPAIDPVNRELDPFNRVHRGGSFLHLASYARSASRFFNKPDFPDRSLGLRPARGLTP